MAALLALPDWVYHLMHSDYSLRHNRGELMIFFVLSAVFLAIRPLWVKWGIFAFMLVMAPIELAHLSYFGVPVSPYAVSRVFSETHDLFESLFSWIGHIYLPFLVAAGIAALIYWILVRTERLALSGPYMPVLAIALLLGGPVSAHFTSKEYVFQPKAESYSVKNLYMAISLFLGKEALASLRPSGPTKSFAPYQVTPVDTAPPAVNVVVVMGESLGYPRMSLYGYDKPTTPNLVKLRQDPNFVYRKGMSGGVSTDVSVPSFFTLKREPENLAPITGNASNLFRLAKERGFRVHYVSTQTSGILVGQIGRNADVLTTKEDFEARSGAVMVYDDALVDYLKTVDLSRPNFIVLHQRVSHSPYERYTPATYQKLPYDKKDFGTYLTNTYANSVMYTDALLAAMIEHLKAHSPLPVMFFFTSDHGELMGEGGHWGHGDLGLDTAKVPFLFYGKGIPLPMRREFAALPQDLSHYQMGKLVAEALGYRVTNPNDNGDYYINGLKLSGVAGYISYRNNPR